MGTFQSKYSMKEIEFATVTTTAHHSQILQSDRTLSTSPQPQRRGSRLNPESGSSDPNLQSSNKHRQLRKSGNSTRKIGRIYTTQSHHDLGQDLLSLKSPILSQFNNNATRISTSEWDIHVLYELGLGVNEKYANKIYHISKDTAVYSIDSCCNDSFTNCISNDQSETTNKILIESMTSWNTISMCSKSIKTLSPNIGIIGELITSLQLCCNQLKSLPIEIGLLENLTSFSIARNRIVSLPDSMGCLGKLEDFNASGNLLTRLPRSMIAMKNLYSLILENNRLTWIQPEIFLFCKKLSILDLSGNSISCLPAELLKCNSFRRIRLERCPLIDGFPGEPFYNMAPHITSPDWQSSFRLHRLTPSSRFQDSFPITWSKMTHPMNPFASVMDHPPFPIPMKYAPNQTIFRKNDIMMNRPKSIVIGEYPNCIVASDDPLYCPIPKLKESCARFIIRYCLSIPITFPIRLTSYLASSKSCTFCQGPYIESWMPYPKYIQKGDTRIPLLYRLCSPHWKNEDQRIRTLFQHSMSTGPRHSNIKELKSKLFTNWKSSIQFAIDGSFKVHEHDIIDTISSHKRLNNTRKRDKQLDCIIQQGIKIHSMAYMNGDICHPWSPCVLLNPYSRLDVYRSLLSLTETMNIVIDSQKHRIDTKKCSFNSKNSWNDLQQLIFSRYSNCSNNHRIHVPLMMITDMITLPESTRLDFQ